MISVELNFTPEQAAMPFREAGLTVEIRPVPVTIPRHGSTDEQLMLDMWIVENPNNGKVVLLKDVFLSYIEKKKQDLFLHEENKLSIINLFTK